MKVYITKYALTQGIIEAEADINPGYPKTIITVEKYPRWVYKPYWHETIEEASAHADTLRLKKITSMKKRIAQLEKMKFIK